MAVTFANESAGSTPPNPCESPDEFTARERITAWQNQWLRDFYLVVSYDNCLPDGISPTTGIGTQILSGVLERTSAEGAFVTYCGEHDFYIEVSWIAYGGNISAQLPDAIPYTMCYPVRERPDPHPWLAPPTFEV